MASNRIFLLAYSMLLPAGGPRPHVALHLGKSSGNQILNVQRRAIAIDGGIGPHDDFADFAALQPFDQGVDGQVLRMLNSSSGAIRPSKT